MARTTYLAKYVCLTNFNFVELFVGLGFSMKIKCNPGPLNCRAGEEKSQLNRQVTSKKVNCILALDHKQGFIFFNVQIAIVIKKDQPGLNFVFAKLQAANI